MQAVAVAIFYGTQLNIVFYSSQKEKEKIVCLQFIFDEFMCLECVILFWDEMNWAEEFETGRI
jgi:hypothetical protein